MTYLTAIWEPRRLFILKYNRNLGKTDTPAAEHYVSDSIPSGTDELTALPVNESGEWEDVLEKGDNSSHFVNGYYSVKYNRLQEKGYKFVGRDMYYYRKANNEEGKRLSGPYQYRFRILSLTAGMPKCPTVWR